MSRSKKKFPAGVWCGCKSQKKGKRVASKRFRRYTKILIAQAKYDLLPKRSIEITSPWDLGGDGKRFYGYHPECEWYVRIIRKMTKIVEEVLPQKGCFPTPSKTIIPLLPE